MILANVLGIIVVILLCLASYCFIKEQSVDVISCMIDKFILFKKKKKSVTQPSDTPNTGKTCEFEGEDLYNGTIFATDGTQIKEQPQMTCADCTKYIYKDNDGKCYDFIHDVNYNADNYCTSEQSQDLKTDKEVIKCNDICTPSFTPKACPF